MCELQYISICNKPSKSPDWSECFLIWFLPNLTCYNQLTAMINRPGVAGAVLHTALSLID